MALSLQSRLVYSMRAPAAYTIARRIKHTRKD
jgi:hypothetical protein